MATGYTPHSSLCHITRWKEGSTIHPKLYQPRAQNTFISPSGMLLIIQSYDTSKSRNFLFRDNVACLNILFCMGGICILSQWRYPHLELVTCSCVFSPLASSHNPLLKPL